jgi:uncharacterized protein (TIGR02646 family)
MRHIDKDYNNHKALARLSTDTCKNDIKESVKKKKGEYSSSRYGHVEIREELASIYHGKCCYCEVKIRPACPEEVEHYRPKAEISGVNSNGYYWLGNEWSNLMLICRTCNGKKSTKFPLNNELHRVKSHPVNSKSKLDWKKIPYNSGYLNQERPLLINPEYHYPEKLLYHDYTCRLIPIKNNILATTTIKEIELNNDPLVIKKQEIVDNIINRIENQLVERYRDDEPLTDIQFKRQINLIFKDIVDRIHPSKEFSLLGLNIIERFDELILEDIESPFDLIVRNHFVDFLNQLLTNT